MGIGTNAYITYAQTVNREDLIDIITNIDPVDTQFQSSIGSVDATATLHEWPIDTLDSAAANAHLEAETVSAAAITAPTRTTNRVQHLIKSFTVSDVQEAVKSAGNSSSASYLKAKKLKELARDIEFALISTATAVSGDSATAPVMKGALGWITTNQVTATSSTSASAVGETDFNSALAKVWAAGGKPKMFTVYCGTIQKGGIDAFTGNGTRFNEVNAKDALLNATVSVYNSSYGKVAVDLHQIMNGSYPGYVLILGDLSLWRKAWLIKPGGFEKLARQGTYTQYQVACSLTLEAGNQKGAARMSGYKSS
jgi:hypothetical protein